MILKCNAALIRLICLLSICLSMVKFGFGHGTITSPASRLNPGCSGGWCQWCQGSQTACQDQSFCPPEQPCWGAPGPKTAPADHFPKYKDLKDPDGEYWIDQTGGQGKRTIWCPGQNYTIRTYINADHNGIYKWQSMQGNPGDEKESLFKDFTGWYSVNQDDNTEYFKEDGVTPYEKGKCSGADWGWNVPHCRDYSFQKTNLTIPDDLPQGPNIVRWMWYGCMSLNGTRQENPEPSLFVNCIDVIIGNATQCAANAAKH